VQAHGSDLRLRVSESGDYIYPDVMVICGAAQFHPPTSQSTVVNPALITEVTSPSTESDDRGRKFGMYRTLGSLREYWLVSQEQMEVETFYRQADGIWAIGPRLTQPESSIALRCEDISLSLTDIYADVQFNRRPRSAADDEPQ
jgi:Uma2 family endonuclease